MKSRLPDRQDRAPARQADGRQARVRDLPVSIPSSGLLDSMDPSVVAAAARRMAAERWRGSDGWCGQDGKPVSGPEVADQLADAVQLMEARGWSRGWRDEPHWELPVGISRMSPIEMLRAAFRLLWEEYRFDTHDYTLRQALKGDVCVINVAWRCMETLLAATHGVDHISLEQWSQRESRTFDEVKQLATVTAEFAVRYGPRGVAA